MVFAVHFPSVDLRLVWSVASLSVGHCHSDEDLSLAISYITPTQSPFLLCLAQEPACMGMTHETTLSLCMFISLCKVFSSENKLAENEEMAIVMFLLTSLSFLSCFSFLIQILTNKTTGKTNFLLLQGDKQQQRQKKATTNNSYN